MRSRPSLAVPAVLSVIPLALAGAGCIEVDGRDASELPEVSDRVRTVDVELLRTAVRRMVLDADGIASFERPQALGGVELCVLAQRAAFDSDAEFEELDSPPCVTTEEDESTRLRALPADSDLLLSFSKDGFRSVLTTFRTDDHDVAVPSWADNATYFVPMLPEDEALPEDGEADAGDDGGMIAVWVEAVGEYGVGEGVAQLNAEADHGVAPAEGVTVRISGAAGAELERFTTRRDRPQFVSLPAAATARASSTRSWRSSRSGCRSSS